jgi:poly-beta-1,6-N-acetyl-D-glucosamine biosynthesis protein PgaD
MSRAIGLIIFAIVIVLLYLPFQYALEQWFGLTWVVRDFTSRFAASESLITVVLTGCVLMALWVVVALGRWIFRIVFDAVHGVQSVMAGAGEQAAGAMMMEDTLIIDSPSLKRKWLRVVEALFSAAVWVFFIYLFQTIVTTIMWILGLEHIYSYNFSPDSISSTLDAMLLALYTAVAAMVVLVVWAQWNYWRFGRLERRKPRPVVTKEEVAEQFAVPVDSVDKMQAAKFATIQPVPFAIICHETPPARQKPVRAD